jgi:hypothetical protein
MRAKLTKIKEELRRGCISPFRLAQIMSLSRRAELAWAGLGSPTSASQIGAEESYT